MTPGAIQIRYGPVACSVTPDPDAIRTLQRLLVFDPEEGTLLQEGAFPAGLLPYVQTQLARFSIPHEVLDRPPAPAIESAAVPPDLLDDITLRPDQLLSIRKALIHKRGMVDAPCGAGKCLDPDTQVLMFDGSLRAAKDLRAGDYLMGPDSGPREIESTCAGTGPMYLVTPNRGGVAFKCNGPHLLTLYDGVSGTQVDVEVEKFLTWSKWRRGLARLIRSSAEFPPREAPVIDPWLVGLWYAEGRKDLHFFEITNPESEIEAALRAYATRHGFLLNCYQNNCKQWRIVNPKKGHPNALLRAMRELYGDGRALPQSCMLGTADVRAAFLAGFLDGDGYSDGMTMEIVQRHKQWALDIAFIARSLGFGASVIPKSVRLQQWAEARTYWRVLIAGDSARLPFVLPRRHFGSDSKQHRIGFSIEPAGEGPYVGFSLRGADKHFLLGDFTVTHNTEQAAAICKHLGKPALVLVPGKGSLQQTWRRFQRRGLESVGRLGDGHRELSAQVVVAVVNSVYDGIKEQKADVLALLRRAEILIFQEVHHLGAHMWRTIADHCSAVYRIGFSATVYEAGTEPTTHRDRLLEGCLGPIVSRVPDWLLMNEGLMATPIVHMLDMWQPSTYKWSSDLQNVWPRLQKLCIVENEHRNTRLLDVMCPLVREGYRALGLVMVLKHGSALAADASVRLNPLSVQFYRGDSRLDTYRNGQQIAREKLPVDQLVERLDRQAEYCLFGSPAVKEDLDFPAANVLVNFSALRDFRTTVQRTGRVLRAKRGANIAHVVDAWDKMSYVLQHQSRKRREIYEERYRGADRFALTQYQHPEDVVRTILAS